MVDVLADRAFIDNCYLQFSHWIFESMRRLKSVVGGQLQGLERLAFVHQKATWNERRT